MNRRYLDHPPFRSFNFAEFSRLTLISTLHLRDRRVTNVPNVISRSYGCLVYVACLLLSIINNESRTPRLLHIGDYIWSSKEEVPSLFL